MIVAIEPVQTIADLAQWSFAGTALAVIGRPVAHSLSPEMHNAALTELAKTRPEFAAWRYFKFDIAPGELPDALKLFHRHKFQGLNLTVPHKALVVEHLGSKDPFVQAAGAANTLKYTAEWWRGFNTDGTGLSGALLDDLGMKLGGAHVVLLGAGGAARGAAIECLRLRCSSLWIGNRTQTTLETLLASLQPVAAGITLRGFDPKAPPADLPAGSIVINATSLGLAAGDPAPLDLGKIPRPAGVYDMIYRPPQTALLRQAAGLGLAHANGLSMLVHQGARSLELWTGVTPPLGAMQQAARAALRPELTMATFAEINHVAPWFFPVMATVMGACIGSFLNVCIYRIPKNESVVTPPSHCGCGQRIAWRDNIPVLSWLILRGRARCCGRPFSFRYPAIELLTAALFLACWLQFAPGKAIAGMVLCSIAICALFIDLDHMIIPDVFTVGGAAAGLLLSACLPVLHGQTQDIFVIASVHAIKDAMLGMFVGSALVLWIALFAEAILKKEAMGFGDVKYLGALGAFVGWKGAVFGMFGGAMLGCVWLIAGLIWKKTTGRDAPAALPAETPEGQPAELGMGVHVPFGPMLGVAALLYFFGLYRWVDAYFDRLAVLF